MFRPCGLRFAPCPRGSSRFAAFGCALRFAPCARHFSPSGLRRAATGTGMYFSVSHRPSIQHGRSTALASSLVALPASLGLLRPVSATGGGLRAPLRFACAVFRACALRVLGTSALRAFTFLQAFASTVRNRRSASLASSLAALVAHWAHFGLFRALRAAFVRFLNSAWSFRCAHKLACGTPCFIGLTSACFAHCARPSCAPSFLIRTFFLSRLCQ